MTETTLPTGRLILRPFAETDFRSVHDYASDPEVVRYVSLGLTPKSRRANSFSGPWRPPKRRERSMTSP